MRHPIVVSLAVLAVACSGSPSSGIGAANDDVTAPPVAPSEPGTSSGDPAPPPPKPAGLPIYAHTDRTLYELDATDMGAPMKRLGDVECLGTRSLTDIAVTKDGRIYGVTQVAMHPLYVDGATVRCDATWPLPSGEPFYGLTVAPEGTLDAREVFVAANVAGQLFRIDDVTGAATQVGSFGIDATTGRPWMLSGDIVFLANNGSPIGYATVRTCQTGATNCTTTDTLIEIDVKAMSPGTQSVTKSVRGPVTRGAWCRNPASPPSFGSLYGIAAYGDKVFGFSRRGEVVEMRNADGSACLVADLGNVLFAGAGVATSAPVRAPGT
jgi:hypothetical protein